ncbi:hypothetical protein LTR14_011691 [Exophiala xenobiotica]|nr:hypothetical protein LTR14_011691 [Exophiala xenobiotica]
MLELRPEVRDARPKRGNLYLSAAVYPTPPKNISSFCVLVSLRSSKGVYKTGMLGWWDYWSNAGLAGLFEEQPLKFWSRTNADKCKHK